MNLETTIIPKSDQLNADDLLSGPRTIKITAVEAGNADQPVSIRYEGDNGRPYKPGKSMRRVLVAMWGSQSGAYIGQSLTLYCDPSITFGPDKTGGIRISHATGINGPLEIALTVKRGKRKPFNVEPLAVEKVSAKAIQSQAAAPDASLDEAIWAAGEVGAQKAKEGTAALGEWWKTLPAAVKTALKGKLDTEWKPAAAQLDEGKAGA